MSQSFIKVPARRQRCMDFCLTKVLFFLAGLMIFSISNAQVVLDGTFGQGGALSGPEYQISDDLGTITGSNLFHSFSDFNLLEGESATFSGPDTIANILTRVTGNNPSNIDGLLRSTIPDADFFFMNPNGVFFGPNAELDVDGSFVVSTADYIGFADGGRFDAANPESSVLTIAAPNTFGFLDNNPIGSIRIEGERSGSMQPSSLSVKEGEELSLVSGDVLIVNGKLLAPNSGGVSVISVGSGGEVVREVDEDGATIRLDGFDELGEIDFSQASEINVNGVGGGKVTVRAKGLKLDNADILAETTGNVDGKGMDIHLIGDLILGNASRLSTQTNSSGEGGDNAIDAEMILITDPGSGINSSTNVDGKGGDLRIEANGVEVRNGGQILGDARGSGDGGNVTINAQRVLMSGGDSNFFTALTTRIAPGSLSAKGGDIHINANEIEIRKGANIDSTTFSTGNGGAIAIVADTILIDAEEALSFTGIFSETLDQNDGGEGGNITVMTKDLEIRHGAGLISTLTSGSGDGGSITVDAATIRIDGRNSNDFSGISAQTAGSIHGGKGGSIIVNSTELELFNGATLDAASFGSGDGGEIIINAESILMDQHGLIDISSKGSGLGGNAQIIGESLRMREGALILASVSGSGDGGNITIEAGTVLMSGSGAETTMTTQIEPGSSGQHGGSIRIKANLLDITDGASISSSTMSIGHSGDIELDVGVIRIEGQGSQALTGVFNQSSLQFGGGNGGNIFVSGDRLEVTGGGTIIVRSLNLDTQFDIT